MAEDELQVGLVGVGNMGLALLEGLLRTGVPATAMGFSESDAQRTEWLQERFPGLQAVSGPLLAGRCKTLILAVKPQMMAQVLATLAPALIASQPLLISVAAGVGCKQINGWLGAELRIVRAMPNTPALIGAGMTGLYANAAVTPTDRVRAEELMTAVGQTVWVSDEALMHAVTATSGSGPAYVFLLIEAMQAAAEALGLDPVTARQLTVATVSGAARLAAERQEDPTVLRAKVTSPGGTTEQAIRVFMAAELPALVHRAMAAAAQRSRELAGEA